MIKNLKIGSTKELKDQAKKAVVTLWNNEYPEKLAFGDLVEFDQYLDKLSNLRHFLLTNEDDLILGWAFTFERENEKWFAIILSEKIKGKGFGRKILDVLKQNETVLNGWVIDHNNDKKSNGKCYLSPLKFYEKCSFETLTTERLELDKISAVKIKWIKK